MLMVNIADLKAKLSEYLDAIARGEQVTICNRNVPVAELRAVAAPRTGPRDLSPMFPGATFMTEAFFEPMSEEELAQWEGSNFRVDKVAERSPMYPNPTSRKRKKHRA
jgi:antitoxin (DNA-binding transcriptional repressor) of toxin-antitoxin stability system